MANTPGTENRIWAQDECLPSDQLATLQLSRLRDLVARVANVPFYEQAFAQAGITTDSLASLDDLRRLPFTTKADLRDHNSLGFLAVPRDEVVRYHGSSGTTGRPTFVAYTRDDIETWANLCARFLTAGGLRPSHVVQMSFGYGLFTGGFGLHYGIEKVGAGVIPAGSGNTERQILLMQELGANVLVSTPTYALRLSDYIKEKGIDRDSLSLEYAYFGAEPWTEDMRIRIETDLGIRAFNNYGLSEVIGPGVSGECARRDGMHIQEDHFLVECINPDTLEPVPDGEAGELVFTTLTKQAFPLIRYRTRDISRLDRAPCPCGRTTARMSRVSGRTDDMLIIRGVNIFPSQVEEALLRVEGVAPHYLIELTRPRALDEVTVHVETTAGTFSNKMSRMHVLRDRITREIRAITGLHMNVTIEKPRTLDRSSGKAKHVLDRRSERDKR